MFMSKRLLVGLAVLMTGSGAMALDGVEKRNHEHRAAMKACMEELGIPQPERGERPQAPSEEVRERIDSCMKSKGFEKPLFKPRDRPTSEGSFGRR